MKIRVDDSQLADELVQHLRRAGCVATASEVEVHGGVTVEVQLPSALNPEQARMELELYLKVFEATHPGKSANVLG
jgi:hypothetical protein